MSRTTFSNPFSDNSRFNFSNNTPISVYSNKKNTEINLNQILSVIDESPDFYDPYSDLNLFLSKKINNYLSNCASKKWNSKIQDELIQQITPAFKTAFPKLRLSISALKKTWEKMVYYYEQMQPYPEAFFSNGKLNSDFFIRENLKNYLSMRNLNLLHPSHFAHQLATKLSECIALINAERPQIERFTKLIWSIQRHFITSVQKSPYDEYDLVDKQIVTTLLEMTAEETPLACHKLEQKLAEALPGVCSDRIHSWAVQGDLIYRIVQIDTDTDLLDAICKMFKEGVYSHSSFVDAICNTFQIPTKRAWMLYKHAWYTLFSTEEESSYDRFLKWYAYAPHEIEALHAQLLPLIPFDKAAYTAKGRVPVE